MADNFKFTPGVGATGAADEIGGVLYPWVKLVDASNDSLTPIVSGAGAKVNALRVVPANDIADGTYIGDIKFGESLPAGSAAIGKLVANDGVDIGDVTINNPSITIVQPTAGNLKATVIQSDPARTITSGTIDVLGDVAHDAVDGGNPIKIGGKAATSIPIAVANGDRVNAYLDANGRLAIFDGGGSLTIDGTVAIGGTLPAGTNNIGDVDVLSVIPGAGATNLGKAVDAVGGASDVGVATLVLRDDTLATLTPIDGDYVRLRVNSKGALWVKPDGNITVDLNSVTPDLMLGTDFSGVFGAASLISATPAIKVEEQGTLTVQATDLDIRNLVAADVITAYGSRGVALQQKVTTNDLIVTLDGELVVLGAGSAAIGKLSANAGVNIGDVTFINTSIAVSQLGTWGIGLNAGTNNIGDVDVLTVPAPLNVTGGGVELGALRVTIANNSTGVLSVDDNGGSITVDGSVSLASALPAGTNNIGDVDVLSLPALPAGTNTIGKLASNSGIDIGDVDVLSLPNVTLAAGTNTNEVVGDVADDAVAAGNPLAIGGMAKEQDGTDPGSVSAEGDRAELITDRNRRLYVNTAHPNLWSATDNQATAQTNKALKAAPGAGLSLYVTDIIVSNGATAGNLKFVEDTAGTPVDKIKPLYFAANGGTVIAFKTPIKLTANKDFGYTSLTVTTHSVVVNGFVAP